MGARDRGRDGHERLLSRAEANSTTLHELLERYIDEVTPLNTGAGPETNRLRTTMRHPLARRFVAGIRGMDIASWRDERMCKVSPVTVTRDLVLLGHVFEVARKEWGIYMHNPVRDIRLSPAGRPRDHRWVLGEKARLFEASRKARNPWLLSLVRLAPETAMRQSELLRLRWDHIDLAGRTAHVPDTRNGDVRTVPLKSSAVVELSSLPRALHGDVFAGMTREAEKRPAM